MVNKRLAFNKKKEEKREDAESDESIEISNTTAIEESNEETLHHATEKVNTDEVEKHRRKRQFQCHRKLCNRLLLTMM